MTRDEAIMSCLPMVRWQARKYRNFAPIDDLEGEGNLALLVAWNHYRPELGVKFSTMAIVYVRKALCKFSRRKGFFPFGMQGIEYSTTSEYMGKLDKEHHFELCEAVLNLPERERKFIFDLYWGDKTLNEVGIGEGVTRERVNQIHHRALVRLKLKLTSPSER